MRRKMMILSVLAVCLLSGCQSHSEKTNHAMKQATHEQSQAPEFSLEDINGKQYDLSSLKGKKVYIKFWASWCSICLGGLEEVDELANQNQDFIVLSIVAPEYHNEKNKQDFIKWYQGLEYKHLPVLLDEHGEIAQKYGVRGYPTSVLIDSEGNLVKVQPGHLNNEQIKDIMQRLP